MPPSPEILLQLLQHFIKHSNQIKQIHSLLITSGHLFLNSSVSFSFKWTSTLLYNSLIRAYLNLRLPHTSLLLFTHMLSHQAPPNSHTFPPLVKAASSISPSASHVGRPLHAQALKRAVLSDPFIRTSLLGLYAQLGSISSACNMFEEISEPCIVSYNAMLDAFCKNGDMKSALSLFERMPERDVFSWSSIINGYGKNSFFKDAIHIFSRMMTQGHLRGGFIKPNEATFVSVLSLCANSPGARALYHGKEIHAYIIKNEIKMTVFVGTTLISLYGKVGAMVYAMKVFENMMIKEVCTWNVVICSLALNGEEKQALDMFEKMKTGGWHPNEITFVAVLSACARAKLVELGLHLFESMSNLFAIVPRMEHYGCVVDLLGRAGFLTEAYEFMRRMPFEPDASVFGAILGACKVHGAVELGNEMARRLLELRSQHCGHYVLLSSIYAEAERWDHAAALRKIMVDAGIQKLPAYSMIDLM